MKNTLPLRLVASLAWLSLASATGCHRAHAEAHVERPKYAATNPLRSDLKLTKELVAQVRARQHIEVRALEKGYLQATYIDEGQAVTKGTKMFQLLPILYQAEVGKATAEAELSAIEYKNTKILADKNIVSPNELALAKAKLDKAKAQVSFSAAEKSLTELRAPFDGIAGRFHVRLGSLVAEGDLLTTLSDNSTMWVYFNVSEVEYLAYKTQPKGSAPTAVKLRMANGEIFDQPGKVETIEADFNSETGNVAFRAAFPNPHGLLRHGETGKVLLTVPLDKALIIPQKAAFDVLDKKFVFVVDDQGIAHARAITVSHELPQTYVVASGLAETDTILIDGVRKVRDGAPVEIDRRAAAEVIEHLEVPAELAGPVTSDAFAPRDAPSPHRGHP